MPVASGTAEQGGEIQDELRRQRNRSGERESDSDTLSSSVLLDSDGDDPVLRDRFRAGSADRDFLEVFQVDDRGVADAPTEQPAPNPPAADRALARLDQERVPDRTGGAVDHLRAVDEAKKDTDTRPKVVIPFRVKPLPVSVSNSVSDSVSDTEKTASTDTTGKRNIRLDSSKSKTRGMREIRERWENPDGSTGCKYLGSVSEAMYRQTRAQLLRRRELGYGKSESGNHFREFITQRFKPPAKVRAPKARRG